MAISWTYSSGQPSDTVGSDGDLNLDVAQRIIWGPKGRYTAGSWSGTGSTISGPNGLPALSGTGAPGSAVGQPGQNYVDLATGVSYLKGGSAWSQAGTIGGPAGPPGPISMSSLAAVGGSTVYVTGTLSSTPSVCTFVGTSVPQTITLTTGSAFMGGQLLNASSAAAVFSLVDLTTSQNVFSQSVAASSLANLGQFTVSQYPMISGHQFQWQITGSAAANGTYVTPTYLQPASNSSYGLVNLPFIGRTSTTTTYSATYNNMYLPLSTLAYNYKPYKATSLYYVTFYNQTNAALTFSIQNYTATSVLFSASIAATSQQSFGPFVPGSYPMALNNIYYFSATGGGTGAVYIDCSLMTAVA